MKTASLRAADLKLGRRLDGVSLSFRTGECVVLVGPNGAGKSSLLRALLGLERPDAGAVTLNDAPLERYGRRELAGEIAWLPQRPPLHEARRTVELVAEARYRFSEPSSRSHAEAERRLTELGVGELAERRTDRISGGELQRVLLAALLTQEAPLLFVDEPANHLDPRQQLSIYRKLGELWAQGHGLLVVTHDLRLARLLGEPSAVRVVGLASGRLGFEERLDSPSLPASLAELYGVPFSSGDKPGDVSIDWENVE